MPGGVLVQTLVGLAVCAAIFALFRQTRRYSRPIAAIVAAGILLRAGAGAALFWVSYLDLPFLSALHDGDGFWQLAPDARSYFLVAAAAVDEGLSTIPGSSASPAYTRALAAWMLLVGVSPASAVLMNLLLYVAVCRAMVAMAAAERVHAAAAAVPILAFTFSPALLVFGTQSLKDTMFCALVALCGMGWLMLWPPFTERGGWWKRPSAIAGIAVVLSTVYLMAGIRTYFVPFVWTSAAAAFIVAIGWQPRRELRRYLAASAMLLAAVWLCFMAGAGPYYEAYSPARFWGSPQPESRAVAVVDSARENFVDSAREGFVQTGGATSIASPSDGPLKGFAKGLAALFVPVSVLKWLSVVQFEGGRGLLLLTDADTIFFDALVCLGLLSVFVNRAGARRNLAPVCFLVLLAVIPAILMAYVVTNYGTLFRLRLMLAVPVWLLPLAVIRAGAVPVRSIASSASGMAERPAGGEVSLGAMPRSGARSAGR